MPPGWNPDAELKRLSDQVQKASLHRVGAPGLVPIIIRCLRNIKIDRDYDDPKLYTPTRDIMYQCFVGIQLVAHLADQDTLLRIMVYWPTIWEWCVWLIATVIEKDASTEAECRFQENIHAIIPYLALDLVLCRNPESTKSILRSPGFFATIASLWIRSVRNNNSAALIRTSASMALLHSLKLPDKGLHSLLINTPDAIILCTNHVMQSARKRPTELKLLSGPLVFLRHCISYYFATLVHFPFSPAASAMALVMLRLTSPNLRLVPHTPGMGKEEASQVEIISMCLLTCSSFLNRSIYLRGCISVDEALDGDVLKSLLRTFAFLESNSLEHPRNLLLQNVKLIQYFTCYSLYPSVLRKLDRSLERIESFGLERYVPTIGPFSDAWKLLRLTVAQRIDRMTQFWLTEHHLCCNKHVG